MNLRKLFLSLLAGLSLTSNLNVEASFKDDMLNGFGYNIELRDVVLVSGIVVIGVLILKHFNSDPAQPAAVLQAVTHKPQVKVSNCYCRHGSLAGYGCSRGDCGTGSHYMWLGSLIVKNKPGNAINEACVHGVLYGKYCDLHKAIVNPPFRLGYTPR